MRPWSLAEKVTWHRTEKLARIYRESQLNYRESELRVESFENIFWHTSEITKIMQSPRAEVLPGNIGNLFITPSKAWFFSSFVIELD